MKSYFTMIVVALSILNSFVMSQNLTLYFNCLDSISVWTNALPACSSKTNTLQMSQCICSNSNLASAKNMSTQCASINSTELTTQLNSSLADLFNACK